MKTYKVFWADGEIGDEVAIQAETPEEAYEQFLEAEEVLNQSRQAPVWVAWGLLGRKEFKVHTPKPKEKAQQASATSSSSSRQEEILLRIEKQLTKIYWGVAALCLFFLLPAVVYLFADR